MAGRGRGRRAPSVGPGAGGAAAAGDAAFDAALQGVADAHKEARGEECSILRAPVGTAALAARRLAAMLRGVLLRVATHPVASRLVPVAAAVYAGLLLLEGPHTPHLHYFNAWAQDVVFWVLLGIASSIGFGTGMHSGILFLFPHVYQVCIAADTCGHLSFHTNVFFKGGPAAGLHVLPIGDAAGLKYIDCTTGHGSDPVGFWWRVLRVALPCILWGGGTAVGEVPPYLMAYKASQAGRSLEDVVEGEMQPGSLEAMQRWMIDIVRRWGWWGVFLLAAWPNAFFDLCGLCCGAIRMPFWTFFTAVFSGKAIVKVGGQAIFFCIIFTQWSLNAFKDVMTSLFAFVGWTSMETEFGKIVDMQIQKFQKKDGGDGVPEKHGFQVAIGLFIACFIFYFLVKFIEQLAIEQHEAQCGEHVDALRARRRAAGRGALGWVKPLPPRRRDGELGCIAAAMAAWTYYCPPVAVIDPSAAWAVAALSPAAATLAALLLLSATLSEPLVAPPADGLVAGLLLVGFAGQVVATVLAA